ncbi:MAG: hypothetical protein H7Y86_12175 [Rhizobacter sp.]|nr:hypothetical protein [Ferruginibacter sp.]
MKTVLAVLFFSCASLISRGQNLPSSCTPTDTMALIYHNDACRLAIKRLNEIHSPLADSITIPEVFIDSLKRALYAIHNTQNLLVIDTIKEFFSYSNFLPGSDSTHFFSAGNSFDDAFVLKEVMVTIHNDTAWGAAWLAGNYYNTPNDSVNYLMNSHQLQVVLNSIQVNPNKTSYIIKSPRAINAKALAKKFEKFSGVGTGNAHPFTAANYFLNRNKRVLAEYQNGEINLSYSYGCGDCPSGCTYWRIWKFLIHANCSVDYISIQNYGNWFQWLSDPCLQYMQNIEMCPTVASAVIYAADHTVNVEYQWQISVDGINYNNINNNSNYTGVNTTTLHLNNIPSSWNGYKYSLLRNGQRLKVDYYIRFINNCINAVSTNWEDAGNWSCGVLPDSNTDVVIKQGTLYLNTNVSVRSITILPGASLNISPGALLTLLNE